MSIASWIAEFYPEDAATVATRGPLEAAKHSLRKWEGLMPESLAKHNLQRCDIDSRALHVRGHAAGARFIVDGDSCALCRFSADPATGAVDCDRCPLARARDGASCEDQTTRELMEETFPPYSDFIESGDPAPMIHDLYETIALLEREAQEAAEEIQS